MKKLTVLPRRAYFLDGHRRPRLYLLVLAIIRARARKQSDFLLKLAANGARLILTLAASLLAIISPCSQTETSAHISCQ
jgi:hypothetical protein